jgi:hypothetical protein
MILKPEHDLVAVAHWIDGGAMDGLVKRPLASAKYDVRSGDRWT